MSRLRSAGGQASVELVALLPLLAGVAVVVLQLLAAGASAELAEHAAEAGAVALLEGGDPADAARDAVPAWSRGAMAVRVSGRTVRVRVRPLSPVRGVGELLAHTAEAHAGRAGG